MTSKSLRALSVFPCGACRALVALPQGCLHWPPSPESARAAANLADWMALGNRIIRDIRAGVGHGGYDVLHNARRGVHNTERKARYVAYKLRKKGLLKPASPDDEPGLYELTDAGHHFLDAIEVALHD